MMLLAFSFILPLTSNAEIVSDDIDTKVKLCKCIPDESWNVDKIVEVYNQYT